MLVILVIGLIALNNEESKIRDQKGDVLNAVLHNTYESYSHWIHLRKNDMEHILGNPKVVELTQAILKVNPNKETLTNSAVQKEIRAYFKPILDRFDDIGIFIISMDTINYSSIRDENLCEKNLIAYQRREVLEKVYKELFENIRTITEDLSEVITHRWEKKKHFENIRISGSFDFLKETYFHKTEKLTKNQFIGIALSQGGLEALLKRGFSKEEIGINTFLSKINEAKSPSYNEMTYNYHVIYGI